ncbi:MAG TPA: universal stress protein [Actinoplanes sp.]|nr:universal stress protein [Actinoplanes sp.]
MTDARAVHIMTGYDDSPAARAAIEAGTLLLPTAHAWITHLWTPPIASETLRHRLWSGRRTLDEFVAAIEREDEWEAGRVAGRGVMLARASGWDAEPLVHRTFGGEGLELARLARSKHADLILVGSRGLDGTQAILGSVSDMVAHYATTPVLVVPHPLVQADYTAIADGPLLIGWDGSTGAAAALAAAGRLFSGRKLLAVSVGAPGADLPAGLPETVLSRTTRVTVDAGHGMPGHVVADALAQCARARSAAAVVVGSRGRSAVAEILLGSAAMATSHRAHRAVVVPGDRTAGSWAST